MSSTNIIVPLYNEEKRADPFLNDLIAFCRTQPGIFSITLVNDGSTDNTLQILQPFTVQNDFVQVISYEENRGKGYAVKKAVLESNTDHVIFIDADGAISPEEIPEMMRRLEEYDVVVGSRALEASNVKQHPYRKFVGVTFNIIVNMIFRTGIKDNLCGLKGFRKPAADILFKQLRTERWIFDVEIFYRIKKDGFTLYQMPINWVHKTGSKIKWYDPVLMFFNLLTLRWKLMMEK